MPQIKNVLGTMPGVDNLPMRPELPDIMTRNDETRVKTAAQWKKRREAQTFDHFLTMDEGAEAVKASAAARGPRPSDPANPMPGSAPR